MTKECPIQQHASKDRGNSNIQLPGTYDVVDSFRGTDKNLKTGTEMQMNPHLECNLASLKTQRLKEDHRAIYIPLLAKANLQARDDDLFPLMENVQKFLASEREVMLILGDSGAGKSTFDLHLERHLWTDYKQGEPIPLYINLAIIDNPAHGLIEKELQFHNFSEEQIMEMKLHRQLILICDGYDESQLKTNLHTTNQFNRPGQWQVKVVINCRSQYLGQNYRSRFQPQPANRYQKSRSDLFQEAVLAPFSKKQIEDYVNLYVPLESRIWVPEDYMRILLTTPNLMDLVKNPFLLMLSLEVLPAISKSINDLSTVKVSRVHLYDAFVIHWLDVSKRRLESNALSVDERQIFDQLLDAGFAAMGVDFSTRLALAIFERQEGKAVVQYTHLRDRDTWKAGFFGQDPEVRLLQESSPLTRSGSQFRFLHRSMLEYFYSRTIYDPARLDDNNDAHAGTRSPVSQSIDTEGPLFKRNLLTEPSIIQFVSERVNPDPDFKQQLRSVVDQSKTDATATIAATNAITILVKAGVTFHGVDLSDIKIPGADLSDGQFDSALFRGADLTSANLARTWLRRVDMNGAQMEGVQFGELPYLTGDSYIRDCVYSPNGELLAVGLEHAVVEIYDTTTWTRIRQLQGHFGRVCCVAFSPDSLQLVSGCSGDDKSVRSWDIAGGNSLLVMRGHIDDVNCVEFSPSGAQIASASFDQTVRLWCSQTGSCMFKLVGHNGPVTSSRYSPDGRQLVTGSKDGTVRFWNPETGEAGVVWSPSMGEIGSLAYSPDGHMIASGHGDGEVQVWHTSSGEEGPTLLGHSDEITGIAFSPTDQWIASSSKDGTVRLWDPSTGTLVSILTGRDDQVCGVTFSPDGLQIASAVHFKARVWEVSSCLLNVESQTRLGSAWKVAYSPDSRDVLSVDDRGALHTWDSETGVPTSYLNVWPKSTFTISRALSPNGQQLAIGVEDSSIRLCDIPAGAPGPILEGHSGGVCSLAYSPCGRRLASASRDGSVRLWELRDIERSYVVAQIDRVVSIIFSPSGNCLVFDSSKETTINVFDLHSKTLLSFESLTGKWNTAFAYSPNGQQLAIGTLDTSTLDKSIYLWDLQSEAPSIILDARHDRVCRIAYSPCNRWIASCGFHNTVHLWYRQPGEVGHWSFVTSVRGFFADVLDVTWNPVVQMEFATGCADGSVRVWRISRADNGQDFVVNLLWGRNLRILCADDLVLKDAIGLNPIHHTLLVQRGAIDDSVTSDEVERLAEEE
jgi:WD40 repeat protein